MRWCFDGFRYKHRHRSDNDVAAHGYRQWKLCSSCTCKTFPLKVKFPIKKKTLYCAIALGTGACRFCWYFAIYSPQKVIFSVQFENFFRVTAFCATATNANKSKNLKMISTISKFNLLKASSDFLPYWVVDWLCGPNPKRTNFSLALAHILKR